MTIFGLDISHHQDPGLDLARCRREGIEFVFIKATEGATFVDPEFAANLAEARAAGQLVAAYHYVRAGASPRAQAYWVANVVPRDVPVIPDVEANSGTIEITRRFIDELRALGYSVPLLYLPRWYWQQIGSPDLRGLPPLWSSRYPDTVVGTLSSEWASVPASYWTGYGGLDVAILQFTSSAAIAGHQPLDANAYRGTRDQLAALLGGGEADTVSWTDNLAVPDGPNKGHLYTAGTMLAWTNYYAAESWTKLIALQASVAALATDPNVTATALAAVIDEAVAAHVPTAEQTAAALLPMVEQVVERVLGVDNRDLAAEVLRQLRDALPSGTTA